MSGFAPATHHSSLIAYHYLIWQHFNHNVLKVNFAFRIMALEGNSAAAELLRRTAITDAIGLGEIVDNFVIDLDNHLFTLYDDVFGIPFIVFHEYLFHVLKRVNAAGFAPVGVALVHLNFVAFRGPSRWLISRVNKHTGVGAGHGFNASFPLKILEIVVVHGAFVKEVRAGTIHYNSPVLNVERTGAFFGDFPAIKRFAVKNTDPPIGRWAIREAKTYP